MEQELQEMGHEGFVANPRKVRLIGHSGRKSDRNDVEALACLCRLDPKLLAPIRHRKPDAPRDLLMMRARDCVIESRTRLINHCRTKAKTFGERLPSTSGAAFAEKVRAHVPEALRPMLWPMLDQAQSLTDQVRQHDRDTERLCAEENLETARLT